MAVALFGSHSEVSDVRLYSPLANEIRDLKRGGIEGVGVTLTSRHDAKPIRGAVSKASAVPEEVVPGSDLVVLALPATHHESILSSVSPHLRPGVWIGALCARGAFDLACIDALGTSVAQNSVLFGFQTLPWACRETVPGAQAVVLGTKACIDIATWPASYNQEVATRLGDLLRLKLTPVSNFLTLTLANVGQLIHPGVMYGQWSKWDGAPIQAKDTPLFYQGIDEMTADVLQRLSEEVHKVAVAAQPHVALEDVRPLHMWLQRAYPHDIADTSSLLSSFHTNRSYEGLTHPMKPTRPDHDHCDMLLPNFSARYLTEDGPYGLVVLAGIARLLNVDTPTMDQVIRWFQGVIGKDYLCDDGTLTGKDMPETRAPQRYNVDTFEAFVQRTLPAPTSGEGTTGPMPA